MANFFVAHSFAFLDEEFDAPDAAADHELCRGIAAGKLGLHPDVWGNHDPLTTLPAHFRKPWRPPIGYPVEPVDPVWEAEHRRRPVEPSPIQRPKRPRQPGPGGEVQLTCDDCQRRFRVTMYYYAGDQRPAVVQAIRLLGKDDGWTCIVGRDRCPKCSQLAPPESVGDGAGTDQGNEQHA